MDPEVSRSTVLIVWTFIIFWRWSQLWTTSSWSAQIGAGPRCRSFTTEGRLQFSKAPCFGPWFVPLSRSKSSSSSRILARFYRGVRQLVGLPCSRNLACYFFSLYVVCGVEKCERCRQGNMNWHRCIPCCIYWLIYPSVGVELRRNLFLRYS